MLIYICISILTLLVLVLLAISTMPEDASTAQVFVMFVILLGLSLAWPIAWIRGLIVIMKKEK